MDFNFGLVIRAFSVFLVYLGFIESENVRFGALALGHIQ